MIKKIKFILIGTIAVLSFTMLILFNFIILPNFQSNLSQNLDNEREKRFAVKNITIFIDYSGAQENQSFHDLNLTNYETSAYHALLNCCDIKVRSFSWGLFVDEINGVSGWIYWINDDPPPNIPANYFYLIDNDTVNWKNV
ncbi:MAG: hypothetical protein ACXABO_20135 [Promethearchaeota archaeon]|jgi:hypothetical protein